jgi:hypothetical protein
MGPGTTAALEVPLGRIAMLPGALFCSATDANGAGDRFAQRHHALAKHLATANTNPVPAEPQAFVLLASRRRFDLRDRDPARLDRRQSTPLLARRPCDRTAPDGSISFRSPSTAWPR